MASNSYTDTCPQCGSTDFNVMSNSRPYMSYCGECYECGFAYYTKEEQMSLKEVNAWREDLELKPLTALKEATK